MNTRLKGHVEERSKGRWWLRTVECKDDGRRHTRRVPLGLFASRRAAREAADVWLAGQSATVTDGPTTTCLELFERFLRVDAQNVRPSSRRRYTRLLRQFAIPGLGSREARQVTTSILREHMAGLAARGISRSTLTGIRAVILQALRAAAADGVAQLGVIDTRRIQIPKSATPPRTIIPVEFAELQSMIEASDWPSRALWALLGFAGLRIAEALALTWTDLDFAAHRITITRQAVDGQLMLPKTSGSACSLPMLSWLEPILAAYRSAWIPNEMQLLFATAVGTPHRADNVRRRQLYPLLDRLGLAKRGFHCFRHGLPRILFDIGSDADTVRILLRHSSLAITQRYTHTATDDLRSKLNSAIAEKLSENHGSMSNDVHPCMPAQESTASQARRGIV